MVPKISPAKINRSDPKGIERKIGLKKGTRSTGEKEKGGTDGSNKKGIDGRDKRCYSFES